MGQYDLCIRINHTHPYTAKDTLHWPIYNGKVMGDMKEEIDHFVHAILYNQPFLVDTERAIDAVRLIECCFTSIEIGEAVDCR